MPLRTAQELRDAFAEHWLGEAKRWVRDTEVQEDWCGISANAIITPTVLRAHPELPWRDWGLVFNASMTWELFCERIAAARENTPLTPGGSGWRYLSEHPCMDVDRAREVPYADWDWLEIYDNPRMTLERLEAACQTMPHPPTARHYVMACASSHVPFAYILAHLDVPWQLGTRSALDPHIQEHVARAPCLAWDMHEMSSNRHITLDFVERTGYVVDLLGAEPMFGADGAVVEQRQLPLMSTGNDWDWGRLSANPAMTLTDLARDELPWEWPAASVNPNLTWEFVMDRLDRNWDWLRLSVNLPLERILADATHPWSMSGLSQHPEVGWDTVAAHPERAWVVAQVLRNPMPQYQRRWMAATARQWCAARRLQRFARDVTCNPAFAVARRIRAV